jgi:hypothetical protein
MMIPKDLEANELLVEALISKWRLELLSTNWPGYWLVQLSSEGQDPLALLIDLDQFSNFCQALRRCIDAASKISPIPRGTQMLQTAATELPTQTTGSGAITVLADWETEPLIVLSYYRGGPSPSRNTIRQMLHANDAMDLYDLLAAVYNNCPNKQSWEKRGAA